MAKENFFNSKNGSKVEIEKSAKIKEIIPTNKKRKETFVFLLNCMI